MEEKDKKVLEEDIKLSNLNNYLEKINQKIINLHKEVSRKDEIEKKKHSQKNISIRTQLENKKSLKNKDNNDEKKIYETENYKNLNKNEDENLGIKFYNVNSEKETYSYVNNNKKINQLKENNFFSNKSFIESHNKKYKKINIQRFSNSSSSQKNLNKKKIDNSFIHEKRKLDTSKNDYNKKKKRQIFNNKTDNELKNSKKSLSKSPFKQYSFKPKRKKDINLNIKNEEHINRNIENESNRDFYDKESIIKDKNSLKLFDDSFSNNNDDYRISDMKKDNDKKKIIILPKNIISNKGKTKYSNISSENNKIIMKEEKQFQLLDFFNLMLLYNEYLISKIKLERNEKIIMSQYSSFLIDKILNLNENKNDENEKVDIKIHDDDIKWKSAKIIQRKWRKNIIKHNLKKKTNSNINYELRKMILNNFVEKEKNDIKNMIKDINNIMRSYSFLHQKDCFYKEIIKLIKGTYDETQKFNYYKDYINKIILIENCV